MELYFLLGPLRFGKYSLQKQELVQQQGKYKHLFIIERHPRKEPSLFLFVSDVTVLSLFMSLEILA